MILFLHNVEMCTEAVKVYRAAYIVSALKGSKTFRSSEVTWDHICDNDYQTRQQLA